MTSFNDLTSPLSLMLTRRSGKARDMVGPGPSSDELTQILTAATRVPDHGKLAPWRLVVIPEGERPAFSEALVAAYHADKPDAGRAELDAIRQFGLQAPTLIAVLSCVKQGSHIPNWEQELSAGAVCHTLLIAAHSLGYVGNWLTGPCAYSERVIALLGGTPGDRIAGFIFLGTPTRPLEERPRPDLAEIVQTWRPRAE